MSTAGFKGEDYTKHPLDCSPLRMAHEQGQPHELKINRLRPGHIQERPLGTSVIAPAASLMWIQADRDLARYRDLFWPTRQVVVDQSWWQHLVSQARSTGYATTFIPVRLMDGHDLRCMDRRTARQAVCRSRYQLDAACTVVPYGGEPARGRAHS